MKTITRLCLSSGFAVFAGLSLTTLIYGLIAAGDPGPILAQPFLILPAGFLGISRLEMAE